MSFNKLDQMMIKSFTFCSIPNSVEQILSNFTEVEIPHKYTLHRNINRKDVHTEESQIFGVNVQNIFTRSLCIPVVPTCLQLFSKRAETILIQIADKALIELVYILANNDKNSKVSPLYRYLQFIYFKRKWCISSTKVLFFQLATGGIERAVYRKLIAPFKDDLPASQSDSFIRACAEQKYAYFGLNLLNKLFSLSFPCLLVPLPDTSNRDQVAFIISKNNSYKGLITRRWDNKIMSITYIIDKSRLLWVHHKSLKRGSHIFLLLDIRILTTGMY
jgi:predicted nucleic-acid-binding protein